MKRLVRAVRGFPKAKEFSYEFYKRFRSGFSLIFAVPEVGSADRPVEAESGRLGGKDTKTFDSNQKSTTSNEA